MKTITKTYKRAWRECRMMNWGTLHLCFPRAVSDACREVYNTRNGKTIQQLYSPYVRLLMLKAGTYKIGESIP